MQDTFNLGWKIASVVKGLSPKKILDTYQSERMPVARRLLAFDREIYGAISEKAATSSQHALTSTLKRENSAASGLAVEYEPNVLVSNHSCSSTWGREKLKAGMRFPNLPIVNHSDGHIGLVHKLLNHSGRWSLIIFGGDSLAAELSKPPFEIRGASSDAFGAVRPYIIHCARTQALSIHSFPKIFTPFDETMGFDYTRVFAECHSKDGKIKARYQELVMSQTGCMMLVRPDHHIGFIGQLGDVDQLKLFISHIWVDTCPIV
ncbi:unnamed protein product [Clonostachys rosea]|uniref:FAD-binding domain-containing protein n=1 Tax=Bionectria ochroleuca TaxID=29856 RepID=A0ABY6V0V2_BIOOC|nr:unnamed protein product [Clonostachys rosea]